MEEHARPYPSHDPLIAYWWPKSLAFSSADMDSSNGHNLGLQLLDSAGVGSGYDIGSGATGFVVFLTGAGLPYLELLGPLAEWLG
jgi:hypothetical protein